jgi:site-specific recombinase XerD
LRKFAAFTDDKTVDLVARNDIRSFLAAQTVSNKTLPNYHCGLSVFFKWSINEHLMSENPMIGVERPRSE